MSSKLFAIPSALFGLAAIVLGLQQITSGNGVPSPSDVLEIADRSTADMTPFTHEESGISLSRPKYWDSFEDGGGLSILSFIARRGVIHYSVVTEIVEPDKTLEEYYQFNLDQILALDTDQMHDVEIVGQTDRMVGGAKATELRLQLESDDVHYGVGITQNYVICNGRALILTLTAPASVVDELNGLTDAILASVKFR